MIGSPGKARSAREHGSGIGVGDVTLTSAEAQALLSRFGSLRAVDPADLIRELARIRGAKPPPEAKIEPERKGPKGRYGTARRTWHESPIVGGRFYPTKLQARMAADLDALCLAGKAVLWWPEPRWLVEGGSHAPDALVLLKRGWLLVDAKGHDHREGIRARKQMRERYGVEIRLYPGEPLLPD